MLHPCDEKMTDHGPKEMNHGRVIATVVIVV